MMKGILKERNPQTKFVNPYAMSDPVTQQLHVKPEFRDGRFILKPQDEDPMKEQNIPEKKKDTKPKEPGMSKFVAGVVASDLEKLATIAKRKPLPVMKPEEAIIHSPPAFEPEIVVEPELIIEKQTSCEGMDAEVIEMLLEPSKPEREIKHEIIDIREINEEEVLEYPFKSVEELMAGSREIEQENQKQKSSFTIDYIRNALKRAEIYKKEKQENV
jgi:hypothetical protein